MEMFTVLKELTIKVVQEDMITGSHQIRISVKR